MKLKNLILIQNEVMAHFGKAKIVKTRDNNYKLVGGSEEDRSDAMDWVALFCPEIVFDQVPEETRSFCGLLEAFSSARNF